MENTETKIETNVEIDHSLEVVEDLSHEIESLSKEVHKQNSRTSIFLNGIIAGLGKALGATIVFGIIIAGISYFIKTSDSEWLYSIVDSLGLSTYLTR